MVTLHVDVPFKIIGCVCVCVYSRSLSTSGLRVKAVFLLKNTSEHHLGQFLVRNPFCCMPHFVVHYGEGAAKMTQHDRNMSPSRR